MQVNVPTDLPSNILQESEVINTNSLEQETPTGKRKRSLLGKRLRKEKDVSPAKAVD